MTEEGTVDLRPALRLRGVGLELGGERALDAIDLEIEAGSPVALTGPSGSGKTVLCLVLAGAVRPTHGQVVHTGAGWEDRCPWAVGLVLQDHGLVAGLTAAENVSLLLQSRGMDPDEVEQRTHEALEKVGLAGEADRIVEELSGGERQRVGVARAIAGDPPLVVADEPTSELDPKNRSRVIDLLIGTPAGRIVVVASDDPDVLARFATVVRLDRGRIVDRTVGGGQQPRR